MNRAVENNDRFVVERNGEPALLILSVTDYVKTFAPPPDWLEKSWDSAKRQGPDKLTTRKKSTRKSLLHGAIGASKSPASDPDRNRHEH